MCLNLCLLLCASPQSVQGVLGLLVCVVLGFFFNPQSVSTFKAISGNIDTLQYYLGWDDDDHTYNFTVASPRADYFVVRFEAGAFYNLYYTLLGRCGIKQ